MSFKIFESTLSIKQKEQTIVLIHGFVSSQKYWIRLIPFLQNDGYKVVTIDLLGFGSSRNIRTSSYTFDTHLEHILACLSESNVQSPFILAGHSMGALLSAQYASLYPHNIHTLILLHPPMYRSGTQARQTLYSSGKVYKYLLTSRYRKIGWGLLKFLPAGIANHRGKGREGSLENVIMRDDNLHLLSSPIVKTLLLIGGKDRQIYLDNLDKMQFSKNVTVDVIDAGHHSARSDPKLISRKILEFIK